MIGLSDEFHYVVMRAVESERSRQFEAQVVSRLVAIHPLDPAADDDLTDDLLASNPAFRALVAKSAASPRKPFTPAPDA